MTVLLSLLAILFATLGSWQSQRGQAKELLENRHAVAMEAPLQKALADQDRFARVTTRGVYDQQRHFLLDNQIWRGRAGVYVFTPFVSTLGDVILVNRGWLPLPPDRSSLPEVPTPAGEVQLSGVLNTPPVPGRILGNPDQLSADQWPQLLTYLKVEDLSAVLEQPLENWVIQLSDTDPHGFEGREWKPVFLSSSKHFAYAFQWYALTAACVIMWIVIGFRKRSGKKL